MGKRGPYKKRPITCGHPDAVHGGLGLCRNCYYHHMRSQATEEELERERKKRRDTYRKQAGIPLSAPIMKNQYAVRRDADCDPIQPLSTDLEELARWWKK